MVDAEQIGYDPSFLGVHVPLPSYAGPAEVPATVELTSTHFSVLLRPDRRLAAATAVNIDGDRLVPLEREDVGWRLDRRVSRAVQAGAALYEGNDLDRGHLVRRLDPVWGDAATALTANDETFRYPNAAPQVAVFNQSKELWVGLEDYVLEHADRTDSRLTVLTGPVLADDDPEYREVHLPRRFWKVAAWLRGDRLAATGYVLDQTDLLDTFLAGERSLGPAVEPELGAYRTFQVPIASIAQATGLDLGPLPEADRLPAVRGAGPQDVAAVELTSYDEVTL